MTTGLVKSSIGGRNDVGFDTSYEKKICFLRLLIWKI